MNLTTTLLFYLLFGAAVAVAVYLTGETAMGERWFRTCTAIVFWPLYLPTLLTRETRAVETNPANSSSIAPHDELSVAIGQVEAELDLALSSLDGWSDAVLAREEHRFQELRAAWYAQAQKIRELDALLKHTGLAMTTAQWPRLSETRAQAVENGQSWLGRASQRDAAATVTGPIVENPGERVGNSERARRDNIVRLHAIRERLQEDLLNTLAWVRELATMIHLARYTGAPASRAEELVAQIATAVEGLSEVAGWKDVAESPRDWSPCESATSQSG